MGTGLLTPPTRRELEDLADDYGFVPDRLEKAVRLLDLADAIATDAYLDGRLALTGGTALNMFILDAPRLSFDLDYNYIGALRVGWGSGEVNPWFGSVASRHLAGVKPAREGGHRWLVRIAGWVCWFWAWTGSGWWL